MPTAAPTLSGLKRSRGMGPKERPRASASKRGYGSRWQRTSKAYLKKHPLCECPDCKRTGNVVAAECVDHIIPHRGNMKLFWEKDNWQAMSNAHHSIKTAKENGGFGNA